MVWPVKRRSFKLQSRSMFIVAAYIFTAGRISPSAPPPLFERDKGEVHFESRSVMMSVAVEAANGTSWRRDQTIGRIRSSVGYHVVAMRGIAGIERRKDATWHDESGLGHVAWFPARNPLVL